MREILFRGKRKNNGEWVYGFPVPVTINCYDKGVEIIDNDGIEYDELDYYNPMFGADRVDPETVGQFTGLTDIGGHRIFEGDIMRTAVSGITYHTGVVEFAEGAFGLRCTDGAALFLCFVAGNFTVIGNIHDNQELLNENSAIDSPSENP